jgi:hypothetical protein
VGRRRYPVDRETAKIELVAALRDYQQSTRDRTARLLAFARALAAEQRAAYAELERAEQRFEKVIDPEGLYEESVFVNMTDQEVHLAYLRESMSNWWPVMDRGEFDQALEDIDSALDQILTE